MFDRATMFDYDILPRVVPASRRDDDRSIVDLTLSVTNREDRAIACAEIVLEVPAGERAGELTVAPRSMTCAPGADTPWWIGIAGGGHWRLVPLPPSAGLSARQTATFRLSNVVVNQVVGAVEIIVCEKTSHTAKGRIVVRKDAADPNGGRERAKIHEFNAVPWEVAPGADVTLSWRTEDARDGWIEPFGHVLDAEGIRRGARSVRIASGTIVSLCARGRVGYVRKSLAVGVRPVRIERFDASATRVRSGERVRLSWATSCATACFIEGIGGVAPCASIEVEVAQTTIYTLHAEGLDPASRSLVVAVSPDGA